MALDGLVVHALADELQQLVGGKIYKIHQPNTHDIVMQIRNNGTNYRLLLSANPTYPRVHLTSQSFVNPLEAPMFCMLMRKYCDNGVIVNISQIGAERILRFRVQHRDELGDMGEIVIVVELMGRHSNIILLDSRNDAIIDGIHHVTPAISSHRIVMPGSRYVAPPEQGKANPFQAAKDEIVDRLINRSPEGDSLVSSMESSLVAGFSGVSPLIAREVTHRALSRNGQQLGQVSAAQLVAEQFLEVIHLIEESRTIPTIVRLESGKDYFSIIPLTHLSGDAQTYRSACECLESYYGERAEKDAIKQRVYDLTRLLQSHKNKNIGKLVKLRESIEEAQDADQYRVMGELLTASLHMISKGAAEARVINYYDEEQSEIAIKLDPQLSPSDNAQRYFRKYTKLKNSIAHIEEQIAAADEENRYLDTLLQQLSDAGMNDIGEIREELIDQGYAKRKGKGAKPKKTSGKPNITSYLSSEGVPIYVGKNNTQNDYLTNRWALPDDIWLHTKDIPGSHVVIRGDITNETLHEAAMLAAWHSQAKSSSQVPVDYTLIRHVRKPSGAKPGYVIYDKQKTLFVTPDEQRIKAMTQRA